MGRARRRIGVDTSVQRIGPGEPPISRLSKLRGTWTADLRRTGASRDSLATFRVYVVFSRVDTTSRRITVRGEYQFPAQLGDDPVARLFGHADPCFPSTGQPIAYDARPDSAEIWFTPEAGDCGLVAIVKLVGESFAGRWFEPRFAGHGPSGTLHMTREDRWHLLS
jgi:hypothetical protein